MDKRKRENSPVLRFLRAFFLSSQSLWSLARAVGNPLREAREARKYLFLRTHFLDEYISGQKRTVRPSRVHLFYARRKRRMNHALHLATKFDSFSLEQTKKQEKKKNQHFPRERQREEHTLVLRDFAGVPTKFATCAVLRDVDAENIFYSRVACARFLPNFDGHDTTKRKRSKKGGTEKTHLFSLIFCFFVFSALFCLNHMARVSFAFALVSSIFTRRPRKRECKREKTLKRSWRRSGRTTTPTPTTNSRRTIPSEEEKDKEK